MEFWTSVNVVRRRWYVMVPCLVVFAVLALVVAKGVKPSYQASGTVIFAQLKAKDDKGQALNPYQTLDGTSITFANLMTQSINDNAFKDALAAQGASISVKVTPPSNVTPAMGLAVTDKSPQAALSSYRTLMTQIAKTARDRQVGVSADESTWLSPLEQSTPTDAAKLNGSRVKALIAVTALGILLSLGVTFLVDSIAGARRRRLASEREAARDAITQPFSRLEPVGVIEIGEMGPRARNDEDDADRAAGAS